MQTWESNTFEGTAVAQTDLQNMENNFATLKSCFSGTSAPSNPVEGQIYRNTTYDNWRGYTGAAWVGILQGSASFKLWVYMNAAETGWIVDTTPSDRVLAVKGGSTYTTGGAGAGSWTHGHGGSDSGHLHKWYTATGNFATDTSFNSGGSAANITVSSLSGIKVQATSAASVSKISSSYYTDSQTTGFTVSDNTTFRPAASVGTIQYPDLT